MASKGNSRRPLKRRVASRRYRKLFIIATEGTVTEKDYFLLLDEIHANIRVATVKGDNKSTPQDVLSRMEAYLLDQEFEKEDEAWLVVDQDAWDDKELMVLYKWTQDGGNRGLALSNPKFEYWLLLHFEEGTGLKSTRDCGARLKRHLPDYRKRVDKSKFNRENIVLATERARKRDKPRCKDWPRQFGQTTVYRLVQRILDAGQV